MQIIIFITLLRRYANRQAKYAWFEEFIKSMIFVPEGDYPTYAIPVSDERYLLTTFSRNRDVHILLSTICDNLSYDIGWYGSEGTGMIFYYQMGSPAPDVQCSLVSAAYY